MLTISLIRLFIVIFALIVWYRFELGLFLLFFLLPTYLIRFKFFTIPVTLLEMMLLVIILIYLVGTKNDLSLKTKFLEIKSKIKQNPSLTIAIFTFLLAATISVLTSIDTRSALGEWKAFYIEPVLIFIILIATIKNPKQINNLIFALVLGGLITSLLAIYQKFTGWYVPWTFWENGNSYRVTGWYGFPNAVGLFLAPIIPLAFYLIKQKANLWQYIISIISIPLSILAIIFAKSTGGLIGVIASIGLLLIFWKKTRWPTIILGTLCLIGLFIIPENPIKQELLMQDRSGQLRVAMWGETIEFLSDNPIFGAGLASYKTLIYPYRIDKWIEVFHHPHNIFLTMWVNLGILGLIGFVWILVWFYRVGIMYFKNNHLTKYLLATMFTMIVTGLVDSPYIKNDLSLVFWLLPALMVISSKSGQKDEDRVN